MKTRMESIRDAIDGLDTELAHAADAAELDRLLDLRGGFMRDRDRGFRVVDRRRVRRNG